MHMNGSKSSSSDMDVDDIKPVGDGTSAASDAAAGPPYAKEGGGGGVPETGSVEQRRRPRPHRWDVVVSTFKTPLDRYEHADDHTNRQYLPSFLARFFAALLSLRIIAPVSRFLSGPRDPSLRRQPRLRRLPVLDTHVEPLLYRYTRWFSHPLVLWAFLLAWFLGTTFLARAAWWNSSAGEDVGWLSGTSVYWSRNDACGLDGSACGPFEGFTASYRCPSKVASTRLLNYRTYVMHVVTPKRHVSAANRRPHRSIGPEEVIFQPLVVGGGDAEGTYRADSFICSAAVHRGLFSVSQIT